MKKPLLLCIMDGFGINENVDGNAIKKANTPNIDMLFREYGCTKLEASGMAVGLPEGQMGNSEVGHTNIGAGRIVYQELTRITKSIKDGDFFENAALKEAVESCKRNGSAFHIMGLISDGGVHSHNTHIYALLELCRRASLDRVYVHCILDGRDVPPSSGAKYIEELQEEIDKIGVGKIATVMGRYYAMDRDNRWDRVQKAYNALALGKGAIVQSAATAVERAYLGDVTDEFLVPAVITENGIPVGKISENDSVVFANFRPDRAREITRAFVDPDFEGFERKYKKVHYVCMTQYDKTMPGVSVAFGQQSLANTLGEYISAKGLTQLRIAETEKYAHVTFFFNGGVETISEGEDRALINSPKVATYDEKPDMSAFEVADEAVKRIQSGKYDVIILNFANCDMVGHTGFMEPAIKAVETVDTCVGRVYAAVEEAGGIMLLTADHGNADQMTDNNTGEVFTAHSTSPVPFLVTKKGISLREGGCLADIAPTMIELLHLVKPDEMTGETLICG